MEIDKLYTQKVTNIFENYFSNFYFLKVDSYLTIRDPNLKINIHIKNIVVKGTVSQILYTCPSSFSTKSRKKKKGTRFLT